MALKRVRLTKAEERKVAALAAEKNARVAAKRAELNAKRDSNAEWQRNQTLSKDDLGRRAVEKMVGSMMEYESAKHGRHNVSEYEVRKKVEAMQEKYERDNRR